MILGPEESVFENLVYGIQDSPSLNWSALERRAQDIMQKLGLNEGLLGENFKKPAILGVGGARVTRADRQLISLGRAFVMNPELIVAYKPTALLSDSQSESLLKMFREFVENRGVLMDPNEPLKYRRKRTLIFSAKNEYIANHADFVYLAKGGALSKSASAMCRSPVAALSPGQKLAMMARSDNGEELVSSPDGDGGVISADGSKGTSSFDIPPRVTRSGFSKSKPSSANSSTCSSAAPSSSNWPSNSSASLPRAPPSRSVSSAGSKRSISSRRSSRALEKDVTNI